jgi:CheY-like chemotaxis protein
LAPGQKEYRILVVDDLETNRNLLTLLLEELGFRVSVAENGVVALHLFEEWHPDLILMDLKMPIMDGYEATEQIKALPGGEQTKIIALTASAFEENRQAILHKGADDYIRKPYKEEELFQKISSLLGVVFTYSDEGYEERTDHAFDLEEQHQVVQKLQRLPSEILNQMKTMALNAEKDPLLVMIQRIGIVDRELAATLEELIEKYEYESLSRLIHEALQPEP